VGGAEAGMWPSVHGDILFGCVDRMIV
jgi:hypothetical protein